MHVAKRPAVVEHLVLAKLKENLSAANWDEIIDSTDLIRSLDGVVSLHVGLAIPLVGDTYTFAMHVRFIDLAALEAYQVHDLYVETILTQDVTDELLVLNWECQPQRSLLAADTYRAAHVGVLKFRENTLQEDLDRALEAIQRLQKIYPNLVTEVSVGRAFVPATLGDSAGFDIAFVVACPNIRECDELDAKSEDIDLNKPSTPNCDSMLEDIHVVKFHV